MVETQVTHLSRIPTLASQGIMHQEVAALSII